MAERVQIGGAELWLGDCRMKTKKRKPPNPWRDVIASIEKARDMLDAEADALQYHNLSAGAAFTLSVRGVLDDALERANKLMESAE